MSARDNGGPAFPLKLVDEYADGVPSEVRVFPGMSLREWHKGQALAGLLANPGGPLQANPLSGWDLVNCTPEKVAMLCGEMADAMLSERAKAESQS